MRTTVIRISVIRLPGANRTQSPPWSPLCWFNKFVSRDTLLGINIRSSSHFFSFWSTFTKWPFCLTMRTLKRHTVLLSLLLCSGFSAAIEPISTSIAVGMAAALTGFLASYQNIFYYFHECCRPEWIRFNRTGEYHKHMHLQL